MKSYMFFECVFLFVCGDFLGKRGVDPTFWGVPMFLSI